MGQHPKHIKILVFTIVLLLGLHFLSNSIFYRFDLTQDQRYTLSEAAKNTIAEADSPIYIDVFLQGDLPPEFRKLKLETEQLLEEFSAYNSNIIFNFINPLEGEED